MKTCRDCVYAGMFEGTVYECFRYPQTLEVDDGHWCGELKEEIEDIGDGEWARMFDEEERRHNAAMKYLMELPRQLPNGVIKDAGYLGND